MSFRRYVGKTVQIKAQGADGREVEYIARLFDYDDAGVWLHHSGSVDLPGGRAQDVEGLLFLPHARIINVFAFDGLDELMADEVIGQERAGQEMERAVAAAMAARTPQDREIIHSVGAVQPAELEGD